MTDATRDAATIDALRAENGILRARVEAAEAAIADLRAEALQRRQQVRELVADLPVAMSRKTLLRQVLRDGLKHPDKRGVVTRATNKARRDARDALRRG
ncbi:unannotated protein [freshwater metagenome]|uniref:Unannotated protein n=1 Tax=freshwater metagenome TaxID=449393 RepID=A0A6J7EHR1_9ZZZZ|nr:hypothetical protein [Actinomycetota bacterium]